MITANERLEILALYAEYNRSIDAGDSSAWACTFIQEGVFHHPAQDFAGREQLERDRKSTRLNSSHTVISYAVFCLKKKKKNRYSSPHPTEICEESTDIDA